MTPYMGGLIRKNLGITFTLAVPTSQTRYKTQFNGASIEAPKEIPRVLETMTLRQSPYPCKSKQPNIFSPSKNLILLRNINFPTPGKKRKILLLVALESI